MHRRVLFRKNGRLYILEGKTQSYGKIEIMTFPLRCSELPYSEVVNLFHIPVQKIDWTRKEFVGICTTEEEANDMIDYYLESTWITSENRRSYADT